MTTQNIGLFQALSAKINYDTQRQQVLSQNIANANTPAYRPKDLEKVDFGAMLKSLTGDSAAELTPVTTNTMHLPSAGVAAEPAKSQQIKKTYDVAPTGNAVVMEEQIVNSGQVAIDYSLMTTLYQKNINMMRIALGVAR